MREKIVIFFALGLLIIILVLLNAVSYVQKEKEPDSESTPNRSTYNVGATGTRAFFDLLAETGRNVKRWQKPPSALLDYDAESPVSFVIIGRVQRNFEESEYEPLLKWVMNGGNLVIIDRNPPEELLETTANWRVSSAQDDNPLITADPSDQKQMTGNTPAAKPAQPTILTRKVNAVQPSLFASSINLRRLSDEEVSEKISETPEIYGRRIGVEPVTEENTGDKVITRRIEEPSITPAVEENSGQGTGSGGGQIRNEGPFADPPPVKIEPMITPTPELETTDLTAPVIHLANQEIKLLADFQYGLGRIIFLTDPFIVANNGIGLVDNAQLAINLVDSSGGIIAFDEFHQGFGGSNNPLVNYFEGTPVFAFGLQIAVLIGFILFSQSRRFARPLPAVEPDRLSKLEYVSAMAELQQRTKAFDLAIENIYKEFRRRAARVVGVDNYTVTRPVLAQLIAERCAIPVEEMEHLMFTCEDIIHGEPTGKKEVVEIIGRLREIEGILGLKRRNSR